MAMKNPQTSGLTGAKALIILIVCLLLGACAAKGPARTSMGAMDSPEHHVLTGEQLLEAGSLERALEEFEEAKNLAPKYGPAHVGLGRALARLGDARNATVAAEKGLELAETPHQKLNARLGLMEVYTLGGGEDWLEEVEDQYEEVQDLARGNPTSVFLMAEAYVKAARYKDAEPLYRMAVSKGGAVGAKADAAWQRMEERKRAGAGLRATAELSEAKELTRAQTAALVVEALHLHKIIAKYRDQFQREEFLTPGQAAGEEGMISFPKDIENHPLKNDILASLSLNLRGLQPFPDGRFHPEEPMKRADMALVLEDLLAALTGEETMTRSYVGNSSPFKDVSPVSYSFNAITVCISRGLMNTQLDGRFEPSRAVSGMEAVSGVRQLQLLAKRNHPASDSGSEISTSESGDWKLNLFLRVIKSGLMFLL
jgi:tetratricopeptide (TPR) repeat protein